MQIGEEQPMITIEPIEDPVPGEREPAPEPVEVPAETEPVEVPVPA